MLDAVKTVSGMLINDTNFPINESLMGKVINYGFLFVYSCCALLL